MNNSQSDGTLLASMELSNTKWRLAFSTADKIRHKVIEARARKQFLDEIRLAKEKLGLNSEAPVVCCYEAGRDGFWIYRWLRSVGIDCLVVDPASIEVNRRKRRAKTDRLDAESLVRLLRRYQGGESYVWSVVRVPNEEQEDAFRSRTRTCEGSVLAFKYF